MRKLCLFVCIAGIAFSQTRPTGAPVVVNPPITVTVQNPPENLWVSLLKLLSPAAVGAISALVAVWIANRNARRNLEVSRRHDDEAANRNRDYEQKKTTYFEITKAAYVFEEHMLRYGSIGELLNLEPTDPDNPVLFQKTTEAVEEWKINLTSAVSAASLFLPPPQATAAMALPDAAVAYMGGDDEKAAGVHFHLALKKFVELSREAHQSTHNHSDSVILSADANR